MHSPEKMPKQRRPIRLRRWRRFDHMCKASKNSTGELGWSSVGKPEHQTRARRIDRLATRSKCTEVSWVRSLLLLPLSRLQQLGEDLAMEFYLCRVRAAVVV
jgi:hypothetical protein